MICDTQKRGPSLIRPVLRQPLQGKYRLSRDGASLIRGNRQGMLLDLCGGNICGLPVTPEQLRAAFGAQDFSGFHDARGSLPQWRHLSVQASEDWYPREMGLQFTD